MSKLSATAIGGVLANIVLAACAGYLCLFDYLVGDGITNDVSAVLTFLLFEAGWMLIVCVSAAAFLKLTENID
jgi:hypothetical protein